MWKMTMSNDEWKIVYTKQALKEKKLAVQAGLKTKIDDILETLRKNPFEPYPPYEKLIGNLDGAYSRRLNRQHRTVYEIYLEQKTVKIISMWTHYQNL